MRIAAFAAALLALAPSLGQARITPPLGRSPKPPQRGQQKLWEDGDGQFAIKRPEGNRWSFQGKVRGPDGQQVLPESCVPGRKCYRSALSAPTERVLL